MKITLSTSRLSGLLSLLQAASSRSSNDYRGNILMKVEGNELAMHTTDGEKELNTRISDFEQEGEPFIALLPLKKMMSLVKQAPKESDVSFKQTKNENSFAMTFSGMRARYTLSSLDVASFPTMALEKDSAVYANVPAVEFVKALEFASAAMADGDVRYYLNGVHFKGDTQSGTATVTATDGHRLSQAPVSVSAHDKAAGGPFEVIIPNRSVAPLLGLVKSIDEDVICGMTSNHLFVSVSGVVYKTAVVDGRFPDAQRVIPKSNPECVEMNRLEWASAMNRVAILANEKYRGARFTFDANELNVEANNQEQEVGKDVVDATGYKGTTPMEIGFNVDYIKSALSSLSGETVSVEFSGPNNSMLMSSKDDPRFICVMMPMKL